MAWSGVFFLRYAAPEADWSRVCPIGKGPRK
jgi:hypothetical protein